MKIFIMIVIISNGYRAGLTTAEAEFSSLELCQTALKSIIVQTNEDNISRVVSRGCYEK